MQNLHNKGLFMISDTYLQQLLAEEEQGSFVLRSTRQNQTTLIQTIKSNVEAVALKNKRI